MKWWHNVKWVSFWQLFNWITLKLSCWTESNSSWSLTKLKDLCHMDFFQSHVQWIISKFWYGYRCENRLQSFHKLASRLVIVLCRLLWTDFLCSLKFFKEVSPNTCYVHTYLKRLPKNIHTIYTYVAFKWILKWY